MWWRPTIISRPESRNTSASDCSIQTNPPWPNTAPTWATACKYRTPNTDTWTGWSGRPWKPNNPTNLYRTDGLRRSRTWKPLTHSLKGRRKPDRANKPLHSSFQDTTQPWPVHNSTLLVRPHHRPTIQKPTKSGVLRKRKTSSLARLHYFCVRNALLEMLKNDFKLKQGVFKPSWILLLREALSIQTRGCYWWPIIPKWNLFFVRRLLGG